MAEEVGKLTIALSFDDKALSKSQKNVESSAQNMGSAFSVALGTVAASAATKLAGIMVDLAKDTVRVGINFQSSMSKVAAISGATGDELAALTQKAKEMGATTKFSASEASDALGYMAMAGWKTEDMLDGLSGIMNLAAASGADLAETSDIVTDALTAFGQSAAESGRLADIMAAAAANSNTNVGLLGETFKYVAPVAGALGFSMEDTATAIGLMANAGIKGSQAGTALRSLLTNLTKPTDAMAAAMTGLGISITDTNGKVKPFSQVIRELRASFSGLSEVEKASYAATIAGQQGMSGLLAIVNAAPEDFDSLTEAINNSNGAAEEMAAIMNDNLGGDILTLQSKFESLQISLFEKVEPALRVLADVAGVLIDNFHLIAAAIASFVSGPVGAIVTLYTLCEDFKNFINNAFASIANVFGTVGKAIGDFFNGFVEWLKSIPQQVSQFIENVKKFFSELPYNIGYYLTDTILKIGEFVANAVNKAIEFGSQFLQNVVNFFTQLPGKVWEFLTSTINNIAKFVTDMGAKALEAGRLFFDNIINTVKEIPGKMLEIGKNIVEGIWNGISGAAGWLWEQIKGFCSGIVDRIKEFFGINSPSTLFRDEVGVYMAQGLGVGFVEEMGAVNGEIQDAVAGIAPSMATDTSVSVGTGIQMNPSLFTTEEERTAYIEAMTAFYEQLSTMETDTLTKLTNNTNNWVTQTQNKIQEFITNITNKVTQFGNQMAQKAAEIGKNFHDKILEQPKKLPDEFYQLGIDCIKGMEEGMRKQEPALMAYVDSLCARIVAKIQAAMRIGSPSKVMRDEVGVFLAQGIGVGFGEEMEKVNAEMVNDIELPTVAGEDTNEWIGPILRNLGGDEADGNTTNEPLTVIQNNTINNQLDIQQVSEALLEEIRMI